MERFPESKSGGRRTTITMHCGQEVRRLYTESK